MMVIRVEDFERMMHAEENVGSKPKSNPKRTTTRGNAPKKNKEKQGNDSLLKKGGRFVGTGFKTLGEDVVDAAREKPMKKRGLLGRLKQISAVGLAIAATAGVFKAHQGMKDRAERENIVKNVRIMEDAYGWQLRLPENSPLWNVGISGKMHDLSKLTRQEAFTYSTYLQGFQSLFGNLRVGDGSSLWQPEFTPDRDPALNFKKADAVLQHWYKQSLIKAQNDKGALASLQMCEIQQEMWAAITQDIMKYQKPHERFARAQELSKNFYSQWEAAVKAMSRGRDKTASR